MDHDYPSVLFVSIDNLIFHHFIQNVNFSYQFLIITGKELVHKKTAVIDLKNPVGNTNPRMGKHGPLDIPGVKSCP
jgi:hypothetical protein